MVKFDVGPEWRRTLNLPEGMEPTAIAEILRFKF